MTGRSSGLRADPTDLHEQVKLLVRTEQRLYRSQNALDRELARNRALSELVLASSSDEQRPVLISRARALVVETFDLDTTTAAFRDQDGRWVLVGDAAPAPWHEPDAVSGWIAGLRSAGVYELSAVLPETHPAGACTSPDALHRDVALCVPLRLSDGQLVGYVAGQKLASSRRSVFRPRPCSSDGAFLGLLAGHLERVLQNAHLNDALRSRSAAVERANEQLQDSLERLAHAQQQLVQGQKMDALGRLAGGVAHDFNNLLTVILGNLDLVSRGDGSISTEAHRIEQARGAAERAASITRQLLTFARRQPLPVERVDLNAVVANVARLLEPLVGRRVSIRLEMDDGGVAVMADPGQIEQVVLNLALNARDAMPDGGTMVVATCAAAPDAPRSTGDTRFVSLAVSDTGVGIDPCTQEKVFEPFFTTKEFGQGTGLGLATVYGIVQHLGGAIRVKSATGVGSAFTVLLPAASEAEYPPGTAHVDEPPHLDATLLVVEDDPGVRMLVARMLESHGFGVLLASNGDEALATWDSARDRIDLVLTDVVMPAGGGFDLARALRDRGSDASIVFMSGYPHGETDALGDADAFIAKPFTSAELLPVVARIIAARRGTSQ